MKKSLLTLALAATLSAPAFAADQYLVRVPANVNLSAAAPETPQDPISLSLSAEALPAATVNEPYSFNLLDRLTITGGSGSHNYSDTAWSLKAGDALPPGLTLSNGTIAGTPTTKNEAGTAFEVTGSYQDASDQQVYTMIVGGQNLEATQIAAGGNHACAVSRGAVYCWGNNLSGQLGDGTTVSSNTPVRVKGLDSEIASIALGSEHSCALSVSGGMKCWGRNSEGQLGDSRGINSATPADVSTLSSGVKNISAGALQTCAVTENGAVKCWGWNLYGQLGDGTKTNRYAPVSVSGLSSGFVQVANGNWHTCALNASGGVKCWGYNSNGQLGDGTKVDNQSPVNVASLSSGVAQIVGGGSFSCARTIAGGVKCWGANSVGQLGDGTTTNALYPVNVSGLTSGVSSIAANSASQTCAITASGGAKCWGHNWNGQLGNGTKVSSSVPVDVQGLQSNVLGISIYDHTCAIISGGSVKCWGNNSFGQLGDGTSTNRATPVDVLP